jgi:DNA-directed RNA polymerase specialized sigma24 family protein
MEQEQFKKEILPLREKLFLYARRLLDNPEDAEDVMQEVFLKLWYMRGELDYYNNVMALSVQITKHLCLNRMKVRERTEGGRTILYLRCQHALYPAGTKRQFGACNAAYQ